MNKSHISVQAKVSKAFLQLAIEKELQRILGSNGLEIKLPQGSLLIENIENVQYQVSNQDIQLAANVEVEYNKEEGINIEGQAIIHLVFNLSYEIMSNFTLKTQTKLQDHSWVEKPNLKIGKLNIPSKAALNLLINSFDDQLGKEIDGIIAKKLDLQKLVTAQLSKIENPIPNPLDSNIHLFIGPNDLLFHIKEQELDYALTIHTSFDAEAKWEQRVPQKVFSALPSIQEFDGSATVSKLNLPVKVMFAPLAAMLTRRFATVNVLEMKLQVKSIKLHYDSYLHIDAEVGGEFEGTLHAVTKPRLDSATQVLHLEELKYELKTSSFLVRAAAFLFKGKIDKKLDQFSSVALKPIFKTLIKDLNLISEDFTIEGIDFDIRLDNIVLNDFALASDHLIASVEVQANGQIT